MLAEEQLPGSGNAIEEKSFLRLDLSGRREISLLMRKIGPTPTPTLRGFVDSPASPADIYIMAWSLLKERGMPTISTMRKVNDFTVATTNLRANGFFVYDMKIDNLSDRGKLITDDLFANIPHRELQKRAERLLEIANENGIEIPYDGMFHLVINEQGQWDIILLDISNVGIYKDPANMSISDKDGNLGKVKRWIEGMGNIQTKIRGEQK